MNNLDKQYQALLQDILENGVQKGDRTGTGTISVFGRQIRHKMSEGFPLLTTKKMPFKTIVTELLWFLRGDTNIKFLVDNNCHIWDGDAYKNYQISTLKTLRIQEKEMKEKGGWSELCLEPNLLSQEEFINKIKTDEDFTKKWGELGPIYGKQWRSWDKTNYNTKKTQIRVTKVGTNGDSWKVSQWVDEPYGFYLEKIDQIQNSIDLLKTDPDSRRNRVSAWNVGELDKVVLPPCHTDFQFYTRELSLDERHQISMDRIGHSGVANRDNISWHETYNKTGIPARAISLMWNQRSVDTFLGLPFNIASYGLLLEIIAKAVNMVPDELIGNLGDVHLYSNHVEQAKEQIGRYLTDEERYNIWFDNNYETGMERYFDPNNLPDFENDYYEPTPIRTREPYPLPKLNINTEFWPTESGSCGEGPIDAIAVFDGFSDDNFCKCLLEEDLQLYDYKSHPTIKAPLSN